jgi:hypothetical protein
VIFQLILLALATTVRPTSLAAVYALLRNPRPRRYLTAYLLAGVTFTVAFGLAAYAWFHGISTSRSASQTRAIAEIVAGVISLFSAVLLLTGRIAKPKTTAHPHAPGRWQDLLNRRVTVGTAALAGPVTHIPGLLYLLALNLIITEQPHTDQGVIDVLVFNAVWFAIPIAALVICIVSPASATLTVESVDRWGRQHARVIVTAVLLVVGIALLIHGLLNV